MENIDGASIFWLFAMGMVLGALAKFAMGKKGLDLIPNVLLGIVGTISVGGVSLYMEIPAALMLGALGAIATLFLGNVFSIAEEH